MCFVVALDTIAETGWEQDLPGKVLTMGLHMGTLLPMMVNGDLAYRTERVSYMSRTVISEDGMQHIPDNLKMECVMV